MKIKVWVVTTIPAPHEEPRLPRVFGSDVEADACADKMLRAEWKASGVVDHETGEQLPYPGNWCEANELIGAEYPDRSWGGAQITSHEIEIGESASPAGEYLDRFPPEARPHADRAYQDGYEDGANSSEAAMPTHDTIEPAEAEARHRLVAQLRAVDAIPADVAAALCNASAAISSMGGQIGPLRGMFGDGDGAVEDAVEAGDQSVGEIEAVLAAYAVGPAPTTGAPALLHGLQQIAKDNPVYAKGHFAKKRIADARALVAKAGAA